MRDRLINLLKNADKYASGVCIDYDEAKEVSAEYLIGEGVIVLPCKVGDTLYVPVYASSQVQKKKFMSFIEEYEVTHIEIDKEENVLFITRLNGTGYTKIFSQDDFGKIVFLTLEEAERAPVERLTR